MFEKIHGPITLMVRLQLAGRILLIAIAVLCLGVAILHVIGHSSPKRFHHGKFVLGWMVAGVLIGGFCAIPFLDGVKYWPNEADLGGAFFGLLAGWILGTIHGGIAVWKYPKSPYEGEQNLTPRDDA